jgi:hypothetical protein
VLSSPLPIGFVIVCSRQIRAQASPCNSIDCYRYSIFRLFLRKLTRVNDRDLRLGRSRVGSVTLDSLEDVLTLNKYRKSSAKVMCQQRHIDSTQQDSMESCVHHLPEPSSYLKHLSKDDVTSIEPRCLDSSDKELRSVRVGTGYSIEITTEE